jgi:hypothetical protein
MSRISHHVTQTQTYYFDKKTHPPVGPEDDEHEVTRE